MTAEGRTGKQLKELIAVLNGVATPEDLLAHAATYISRSLELANVAMYVQHGRRSFSFEFDLRANHGTYNTQSGFSIDQERIFSETGEALPLPCFWDGERVSERTVLHRSLIEQGSTPFAIIPLRLEDSLSGWIECSGRDRTRSWLASEQVVLKQAGDLIEAGLQRVLASADEDRARSRQTRDRPIVSQPTGKRLQRALDEAPWMLIDVLDDGAVAYASARAEEITGFSLEYIRSHSVFDLLDTILVDVYRAETHRKIRQILHGEVSKTEFFIEIQNPQSKATRQVLLQAESGLPDSPRMVLLLTDVSKSRVYRDKLDEAKLRSMRLVEYGNLIIIRTDTRFRIIDVLGDTNRILGVPAQKLLHDEAVWNRFLELRDFRKIARSIRNMGDEPRELSQEIQVVNQHTGRPHWLLLTAVPLFSAQEEFVGWEGFGLDITEKRETERKLIRQRRRIEALYQVSRNVQVNMDPAFVALHGLRALMRATSSDSGFCVLYDRRADLLELVAAQGCSQNFVDSLARILNKKNLVRQVIGDKKGFFTNNMREMSAARYGLAVHEGIHSAIFMPLSYEDPDEGTLVVGCLQLSGKGARRFTQDDFDLVEAAAGQIALVLRQAEYYEAEKREASSLAVLYRLSHALAKTHSPEDVAEATFAAMQEEIACKRLWFGVMNDQGTHLVGHGGTGPGMRDQLNRLQIEMQLPHDFLDEAIASRQPVVIQPGEPMECSGLTSILNRMEVSTVLIIPLIALGNVVGVVLLEPTLASGEFMKRKLPLLVSMANEVGAVLLTRKLEDRIVSAEKMRMAGLLASGVAHNFNNLLQAVMGQASLIEMQLPAQSPLRSAAQTITSAAARGAELIKHMLSVAQHGSLARKPINLNELLEHSRDLYSSILGTEVSFSMTLPVSAVHIRGDSSQLQQVFSNLLMNCRDALAERENPRVSIETTIVRLRSGDVDPQLAPGQYVRIDVADNGGGMDEESQARCFEPFYTTKNIDQHTGIAFDGAGFGLSLSYSILRQHDGFLSFQSTPGEGTIFSLYIPTASELEEKPQPQKEVVSPVEQGPRRLQALILDVEDSAHLSLKSALESIGFGTRIIADSHKAIEFALTHANDFDLLLLDLDRADQSVASVLRTIRTRNPDLHILASTRDADRWHRVLSVISGIDIVDNPIGVWAIHSAARRLISRNQEVRVSRMVESNGDDAALKAVSTDADSVHMGKFND